VGRLRFVKGHGTGNDFVVLPDPAGALDLTAELVRDLCDRHRGIGADGVLRVVRTSAAPEVAHLADSGGWFMDYRNADGSVAEMCGNGIRVYVRYLLDVGLVTLAPGERLDVVTRDGVKHVVLGADGLLTVDMGPAKVLGTDVSVTAGAASWPATHVDVGNPHAVVHVEALGAAGALVEPPGVTPPTAFPDGVNVEFVVERGEHHVAMRVHERGVGETQSCGTGAVAAALATATRRDDALPVTYTVDVPGGRLTVLLAADGHAELSGPAELVATGETYHEE
jgi:diaminopimelate epimerase